MCFWLGSLCRGESERNTHDIIGYLLHDQIEESQGNREEQL